MVDPYLQRLADEPLRDPARINNLFLPNGRKPIAQLSEEERRLQAANSRLKAQNTKQSNNAKRAKLLDYYATTKVPFSSIAAHLKMKVEDVATEMRMRLRLS